MCLLSDADVLVTGGADGIGSTLVDQLLEAGVSHVTVLDDLVRGRTENLAHALASGRVTLVEGDVCDRDVVHDVTRGKDLVFHQVLDDGTCNVVQAAAEHHVDKLVVASAASVYGLAEQLRSFRAGSGLDYVMLHYFNAYGPRIGPHGLYGEMLVRWMERIDDGIPPRVFGDGGQTIDLAFTTDVARANVLAAKSAVTEGVYHVASGHETSLLQVADTLLLVMCADLAVALGPEPAATGVVRPRADTSAAACDLGFVAQVGLEEGLRRLVEWWQPRRGSFQVPHDLPDSRRLRLVEAVRSAGD